MATQQGHLASLRHSEGGVWLVCFPVLAGWGGGGSLLFKGLKILLAVNQPLLQGRGPCPKCGRKEQVCAPPVSDDRGRSSWWRPGKPPWEGR